MYTVDIDTGGTMTDGLVWEYGTTMVTVKVDTTPHDLTVSFRELLGEAARQLGFGSDLSAFLDEVSLIRWSSTITSNTLGERKGAKLGLLVQPGSERSLYGDGPSPAVGTLVAERNVVGVDADADGQGVLDAVRKLLEDGARRICVSLDSFPETRAGAGGQADRRVAVPRPLPGLRARPAGQRHGPGRRRADPDALRADQRVRAQPAGDLAVQGRGHAPLRRGLDRRPPGRPHQRRRSAGRQDQGRGHDRVRSRLRHACRRVVRPPVRTGPGRVPGRRRDHRQVQRGRGRPAPLHPRRQRVRHPGLHSFWPCCGRRRWAAAASSGRTAWAGCGWARRAWARRPGLPATGSAGTRRR